MYIQITTQCNMKCAHCCFECEPGKGTHMTVGTFRKALALCDEFVTIGGGEPTVHPKFETILLMAVAYVSECGVHVITNGKHKRRALMLAGLTRNNVVDAQLSRDRYHEKVSKEVIRAFGPSHTRGGFAPLPRGRHNKHPDAPLHGDDCACPWFMVEPSGDIRYCGCPNAPVLGNVHHEVMLPSVYNGCFNYEEDQKEFQEWLQENNE